MAQSEDFVQLASQTGRLDFVSALLASIAVALVLGGILAFLDFRRNARRMARAVAQEVAENTAERVANEYLQAKLPEIVKAYEEFIKQSMPSSPADAVAHQQPDGERK